MFILYILFINYVACLSDCKVMTVFRDLQIKCRLFAEVIATQAASCDNSPQGGKNMSQLPSRREPMHPLAPLRPAPPLYPDRVLYINPKGTVLSEFELNRNRPF